jgi:ribosomal protein L40E
VNGPYVVQAQWSVDYVPIIELFGGLGASITAVVVAVAIAYRRGALTRGARLRPQKTSPGSEQLAGALICGSCGNNVPKGATFCEKCGASMTPVTPTQLPSLDEKVYDYILKHEGTISLSEASTELGIPIIQLKEMTERLKKRGLLG